MKLIDGGSIVRKLRSVPLPFKQIAGILGVSVRTIYRWNKTGGTTTDSKARGRPCKLANLGSWISVRLSQDPYQSQINVAIGIQERFHLTVHRSTVSRTLKKTSDHKKGTFPQKKNSDHKKGDIIFAHYK